MAFEDVSSDDESVEMSKAEKKYVHVVNRLNHLENEIDYINDDLCKLISRLNNVVIQINVLKDILLD